MSPNEPADAVPAAESSDPVGPNRPVAPTFPTSFTFGQSSPAEPCRLRAAGTLVAIALLATLGWVGVYLVAFGSGDASASAERAVPVGLTPGAAVEESPSPAATKKPSAAAMARAAAKDLPKGKMTDDERRLALKKYTDAIGLDLSNTASPATAARSACRLLGTGTEPTHLVEGIAKGAKITKAESRAFLLGATSLYCPKEAKAFRR